ncbi:ABC-three component system middle component 6 [Bathymodiolus azoricus thioautotrophic gill symbiont]|jgi:hypothetical protein|uniref:ABC-three component system middle component 6 n=1 Tax=Bathymodiolus azoricus thioautotrophic gill symbiont TaxID=235205 RepID=UPI000B83E5D6|nr:ABC-three component system middle component 6 [Bathymodiolus azoricus thioautotrophic gill symbiont]VVH56122.1 hypothetical protein BAZOLSSOX_651 [uncultured Gammaproteobacteria bacterium]
MILPTKHINFSQSLLGLGSYVLLQLQSPKSIDELWEKYEVDYENRIYLAKHSFDNLIMTLLFLYSIGSVLEKDGVIKKCV